ncbi:hypothetical protein D5F01_LYC22364 [Xyrichtys novacula]|uniref:Endonuclease/exonuclease/phosphatase domain-containing protein n=1 Tax=Xyrichtys novacula TaxID=13765 RepID=A0AAV1EIN9_XYRNO|nr:hypothetical protein D5F01_LYC22364 [Xyrichtys novacula]
MPTVSSFEHVALKLPGSPPLIIAIIYRPPKPSPDFLTDLSDLLTQLCALSPSVLLLCDFNIHIDNPSCSLARECFSFTQHCHFPTHNHGYILDLICSTGPPPPPCHDLHIADHLLIKTVITLPDPPTRLKRTINFRNLKSISPSALTAALSLNLTTSPSQASDNPSDLVTYYNQTLSSCLNLLAPVKSKSVTFACSAPWYTPALHQLKQKKRQL